MTQLSLSPSSHALTPTLTHITLALTLTRIHHPRPHPHPHTSPSPSPSPSSSHITLTRTPIHCFKVDVDSSWRQLGLEGLLEGKAFIVMTVEVDATWGHGPLHPWNITVADQLLWLVRRHGYDAYVKIPCRHRPTSSLAAWYLPLADGDSAFQPTNYVVGDLYPIADLLIVDRNEHGLAAHLVRQGRRACMSVACQRTACAEAQLALPSSLHQRSRCLQCIEDKPLPITRA